jgi:hypothetical protein
MILVRNVAPHGSIRPDSQRQGQQTLENPTAQSKGRLVHVFRKQFPLTEEEQQL